VAAFQLDNEHIWTGYRIGFNSKRKILRTLFMVHNESVNVWSHLIGAICFIGFIIYTFNFMAPPSLGDLEEGLLMKAHHLGWFSNATSARQRDAENLSFMLKSGHESPLQALSSPKHG